MSDATARRLVVAVRRLAIPTALVLVVACSSSSPTSDTSEPAPAVPTSGWLTLQLSTPRGDDGAVQFLVSGPAIDSVRVPSYNGFGSTSGTTANVVVTGLIGSGTVAQLFVPDLSLAGQYQATVVAAAARNTYALQPLAGYRALLVR